MKSVADVELFPEVGDVKRGRGDKNEVAISWSSCSLFPGVSRSTGVVVGILAWFSKEKDRYAWKLCMDGRCELCFFITDKKPRKVLQVNKEKLKSSSLIFMHGRARLALFNAMPCRLH